MPILQENFDGLEKKFGLTSSWCIWKNAGYRPKSNTSDMSWADDKSTLLASINTDYVFVGLNWSITHGDQNHGGKDPWTSFHSAYRYQNDYKLRYALSGSPFWGSYITDLIKDHPTHTAKDVKRDLNNDQNMLPKNIKRFKEELQLIGGKPTLIALGNLVYEILKDYQVSNPHGELEGYKIVKVKHYSSHGGMKDYRKKVNDALSGMMVK